MMEQLVKKVAYDRDLVVYEAKRRSEYCLLMEIRDNKLVRCEETNSSIDDPTRPSWFWPRLRFLNTLIEEILKTRKISDTTFIACLADTPADLTVPSLGSVYTKGGNVYSTPLNWWSYFGHRCDSSFQTKEGVNEGDCFKFIPQMFSEKVQDYRKMGEGGNKSDKIVFRGTNNCSLRRRLLKEGRRSKYCNIFDVELVRNAAPEKFMSMAELLNKYQYFFILRGYGNWSGTLNQVALSGGVVFKVEDEGYQPFDFVLEKDVDYVSINTDLNNLDEKLQILKDKARLEEMKKNMRKKADEFFTPDNIMNYVHSCICNLYL